MLRYLLLILLFASNLLSAQQDSVLRFEMSTPWSDQVSQTQPWDIYPRPQLTRDNWTNLNGKWDYAITPMTATAAPASYNGKILVPFAVESSLSGVKKLVDEKEYLWYHRTFDAPRMVDGQRLLLHFGAVDFRATVYLNGKVIGGHKGGYTGFSFDVTDHLKSSGKQELIVRVSDPTDKGLQARGKQVQDPGGIFYTPVTGIWQTVWLEVVPQDYVKDLKITPNLAKGTLHVNVVTNTATRDLDATVVLSGEDGREIVSKKVAIMAGGWGHGVSLEVPDARAWSPEDPFLYDLKVTLSTKNGQKVDEVGSYAGMRDIGLGKDANGHTTILLNGSPYFQYGPLDQGYWPDGLYTAPTPQAMIFDLEMTKKWGFNMLRKHVKVEPATFYRACDTMGILVWQDMPSGYIQERTFVGPEDPVDAHQPYAAAVQFEGEYRELIDQFHDFPSIVTWVPFNEGWGQYDTERIAAWTKAYDPSRLVDAPSGWTDRGVGSMHDIHIYPGPGMEAPEEDRASVLGEFGGLGYPVPDHLWWDKRNWGYRTLQSQQELNDGFANLMGGLIGLRSRGLAAAIYTQTTDVEGEINGLMTYDRRVMKIDTLRSPGMFAPLYERPGRYQPMLPTSERGAQTWQAMSSENDGMIQDGEIAEANWRSLNGPFSTFNDFYMRASSRWNGKETLYLRREFVIDRLPEQLYIEYLSNQTDSEIYLNGKLLTSPDRKGGDRGVYTVNLVKDASALKVGRNTVLVKVKVTEGRNDGSFDTGLYGVD